MEEIKLLGKKIIMEKSPLLLQYSPSDDWKEYWDVKSGNWYCDGEWLIGDEPENRGGILFSKKFYEEDVMMTFNIKTSLPATRDLNGVFCANWNEETDYLGTSYVCGLNGWYEHKSGIEKSAPGPEGRLYSTTTLYDYNPGRLIKMTFGAIEGHCFMVVDGKLVTELVDPNPIKGGHIGFSAYCTKLMVKDIEIRKIYWEEFRQRYEPEY